MENNGNRLLDSEENEDINEALEQLRRLSANQELVDLMDRQDRYERDRKAELDFAIDEGRELGREQGVKEGINDRNIEIAKKMLKKNMSIQEAEKILNINIVDFDYLNGQKNQHGIIAEDLYKILPDCVNMPGNYDEDNVEIEKTIMNTPSIDYLKLIPYLIKMLQIQQKQINRQKQKDMRMNY